MKKVNKILVKAKQKHFDLLKKNNAITDAKNGELSLGAMKSLDVILQVYQNKKSSKLELELSYLRKKLGLQRNNDYVERIKNYLMELKLPFELRDFNDVKTGKKVSWVITSFLNDVKSYKDTQHIIEINISENFVNYMIDRAGYTNINLALSTQFKTKYGYKIYEMYLRYYSMPNRVDKDLGVIYKTIDELNEKFGTKHKHASKLMEGIKRGLLEILKLTGNEIYCFYNKKEKKFIFSWERTTDKLELKCIVPLNRVDELVNWIVKHSKFIKNEESFSKKIKNLILNDEYKDLEEMYRGMMQHKYNLSVNEMDSCKLDNGKYKDFKFLI